MPSGRWQAARRPAAAGARARAAQAARNTERRRARVAALGFADLAAYLRVRRVEQGWPVERIQPSWAWGAAGSAPTSTPSRALLH